MLLRVGALIADRYRVERRAGAGASAEVWRVRDLASDELRALKWMVSGGKKAKAAFLREGRILLQLDHPNIIRVRDALEVDDRPALVLDWVDGPSLESRLDDGPLPWAEAERLFRGIAEGVAYAHANGVVHRDLKPANVLLTPEGDGWIPRVGDFGIARGAERERLSAHNAMMGTPGYMAPEQYSDVATADERADVFALGVLLYELTTGERPFDATDLLGAYQAAMEGQWRPIPASVPDRFAVAIRGALVGDRHVRTPSVTALLHALGGAPDGPVPLVRQLRTRGVASVAPVGALSRAAWEVGVANAWGRGESLALLATPGAGATWVAKQLARVGEPAWVDLDGCSLAMAEALLLRIRAPAVVLDHAGGVGPGLSSLVSRWRGRNPGAAVLVVGAAVDGARVVVLPPWTADDARQAGLSPDADGPLTAVVAAVAGAAGTPARTLEDAWAVLPVEVRSALSALAVFAGDIPAEAAREVAGVAVRPPLVQEGAEGWRLGPTLRAWAWSCLDEDARARLRQAHARWVLAQRPNPSLALEAAAAIRASSLRDPASAAALATWWAIPLGRESSLPLGLALLDELSAELPAVMRVEVALCRWELWDLRGYRERALQAVSGVSIADVPRWLAHRLSLRHAASQARPQVTVERVRELLPVLAIEAPDERAAALLILSVSQFALGDDAASRASLDEADLACGGEDDRLRVDLLLQRGVLEGRSGSVETALGHLRDALSICRDHGWAALELRAQRYLGVLALVAGRTEEAQRRSQIGLRIALRIGDDQSTASLVGHRGEVALGEGRLDAARADGQVLLAVAEQMANLTYVAWAELLLASVDERTGQLRHAEARVRRAASLYRSNGMQAYLPVALGMLAAIRADLDDPAEAERLLDELGQPTRRLAALYRSLAEAHLVLAWARAGAPDMEAEARRRVAALLQEPDVDIRPRVEALARRIGLMPDPRSPTAG
jgi:tetratricopeptide (TPR) repeat protein